MIISDGLQDRQVAKSGRLRTTLLRSYAQTPEHPSKYRIIRWLGRHAFPKDGIKHRAYGDIELMLHPRDWLEYWLLRGEEYEPLTLKFVERNLSNGDVAILAGVNFGLHVAVAAQAVGEDGHVIGVEPQPAALLRATQNLRLNNLLNRVTLMSVALGARADLVHMAWQNTVNAGASSLLDEGAGLSVSVLPLSQVIKSRHCEKVRLLLLDVQGYEQQVLAGLDNTCLPEILIVELDPEFLHRANTSSASLLKQIKDLGYSLYSLEGNKVTADCEALPERNVVGLRGNVEVSWPQISQTKGFK